MTSSRRCRAACRRADHRQVHPGDRRSADRVAGLKAMLPRASALASAASVEAALVQIFAKFPDQRATLISFPKIRTAALRRTYNGREGWLETALTVFGEIRVDRG